MLTGLITDIHEDLVSLKKIITALEKAGCTELICMGDIVGYAKPFYHYEETRNADECVEIIRKNCVNTVLGNHDLYHIGRLTEFKAGIIYPQDWFTMETSKKSRLFADKLWIYDDDFPVKLSSDNIEFLKSCPEFAIYQDRFFISHYLFPDLSGSLKKFVNNPFSAWKHFRFIKKYGCHTGICGHVHPNGFQYIRKLNSSFRVFSEIKISGKTQQFCVPPVASGKNNSGYAILDKKNSTITSFKLK
ncbi:MAG: hypothetical protein A2W91_17780 [Bacteroidetes bacterium GWF2_38_335]|nr:MAG: hypothetical protein A2W91_17780 [Bacteroidetes bacterium GWF2_38_335]OFY78015.1 MAG: hypothetical protein A2281_18680 [Bacteroidetes bacterium RIFOXYA12_FULL_38_20]HBS88287.1 hypothetical protein [Bacteroidales bacterium]